MVTEMKLETISLDFDGADVEGRVCQETPQRFTEGKVEFVQALEVIYTDGEPSVSHYQVKSLVRAAEELGLKVLAITDHGNDDSRSIVSIYLGIAR